MEKDTEMPHYRTPMMLKTDQLTKEGYDAEFRIVEGGLKSFKNNKIYQPNELTIVNHHRFEGITNPDDMAILYVVETKDGQKGTIVDAYGMYSNDDLGAFMKDVTDLSSQGNN